MDYEIVEAPKVEIISQQQEFVDILQSLKPGQAAKLRCTWEQENTLRSAAQGAGRSLGIKVSTRNERNIQNKISALYVWVKQESEGG